MKRRTTYHHGNLRAELIAATLRAIGEDGPDGFTLRDVARRAGVSSAAPYRHFADKDELLAAVASDCNARLAEMIDVARRAAPAHPLAQFRATGIAIVQFAAAHPEHFRAMTLPGLEARLPADERARLDAFRGQQREELAAAQEAGQIANIPLDELLLAANALVHGCAHMIVEGQFGAVDAARATEIAIAATGALGCGLIPRAGGLPSDAFRPELVRPASAPPATAGPTSGRRRRPRSATR